MGKNKGGFNVFESYIASGLAYQSSTLTDDQPIPLPDSMRISTLVEQIGKDHKWSEEQIDLDIITLENNRVYYISDLRELSKSSWKAIELLPLVKDLLRNALNPSRKNKKDKKPKKKDKKMKCKKEKQEKKKLGEPVTNGSFVNGLLTEDPETIRNTIQNGDTTITEEPKISISGRKKSVSFSQDDALTLPIEKKKMYSSNSSGSSSSSESDCDNATSTNTVIKPKVFTGRPIKAISGNRIRVHTTDGSAYETDRFCPHKKVDLSTWGQVLGNQLVCMKHNWTFNLQGGMMSQKGRNINPCKVNDW